MPRAPRARPLRYLTPKQLAVGVVLFFLPWVEIQCPRPDLVRAAAADGLGGKDTKATVEDPRPVPIVTQSGFQAATGTYTVAKPLAAVRPKIEKSVGDPDEFRVAPAPLLWGFLLAAVAGTALGAFLPLGVTRKAVLAGCCAVALASAAGQAAMGFPIAAKVRAGVERADDRNPDLRLGPDAAVTTAYKLPLYLCLLVTSGALVTALMEPTTRVRPAAGEADRGHEADDVEPAVLDAAAPERRRSA